MIQKYLAIHNISFYRLQIKDKLKCCGLLCEKWKGTIKSTRFFILFLKKYYELKISGKEQRDRVRSTKNLYGHLLNLKLYHVD